MGATVPDGPAARPEEILASGTVRDQDVERFAGPGGPISGAPCEAGERKATMSTLPIADYALLSDCRSAALVSRSGSVDWWCVPRFDGPSVFARLLDEEAGHWSIRVPGATTERRYLDQTMALETTFRSATGTAVLVDAMAVGRNERGHQLGGRRRTRASGRSAARRATSCTPS
jgi:hypothetical protein